MKAYHFQFILAFVTFILSILQPKIRTHVRINGYKRRDWSSKNTEYCVPWHKEELNGCFEARILKTPKNYLIAVCAVDASKKLSFMKFAGVNSNQKIALREKIVAVDLEKDTLKEFEIEGIESDYPLCFQGFDLVPVQSSSAILFVVNHRYGHSVVEKFRLDLKNFKAIHLKTISDQESVLFPSSILAISEKEFYVTNTYGASNMALQRLEAITQAPLGRVMHYNHNDYSTAIKWLSGPTGITGGKGDDTRLFVCDSFSGRVFYFNRNVTHGGAVFKKAINLNFLPTNVHMTSNGLLITGFPRPKELLPISNKKYKDIERNSIVTWVSLEQLNDQYFGGDTLTKTSDIKANEFLMFGNQGDQNINLFGISGAVLDSDNLYLLSMFESSMLKCSKFSELI